MLKIKKAFTLIELLVVIAIIGMLATVSVLALNNARAKSRDAKRVGDMKQIQTALELFFNDKNRYPNTSEWATGQIYSTSTNTTSTYMQGIPSAPMPSDGSCTSEQNSISYYPTPDGSSYVVSLCLGGNTGSLVAGPKCLTPAGIVEGDCSCGGNLIDPRDAQSYSTVKIGSQCWFGRNLAYLPSVVDGATGDNVNPYYYVYGYAGTDVVTAKASANYINYGVLYNYPAATAACPSGWHLPDDTEWNALFSYLTVDGQGGSGDWYDSAAKLKEGGATHWTTATCDNGGAPTSVCNSTNFTAVPGGARYAGFGFVNQGTNAYFSSASLSGGSDYWTWLLYNNYAYPYHNAWDRSWAFSVRCLRG